jgi:hypothetical protein
MKTVFGILSVVIQVIGFTLASIAAWGFVFGIVATINLFKQNKKQ